MNNGNDIYQAVNNLKADLNNTGCKKHLKYLKVDFNGNYLTSRVRHTTTNSSKFICSVADFESCVESLSV